MFCGLHGTVLTESEFVKIAKLGLAGLPLETVEDMRPLGQEDALEEEFVQLTHSSSCLGTPKAEEPGDSPRAHYCTTHTSDQPPPLSAYCNAFSTELNDVPPAHIRIFSVVHQGMTP